MRNTKERIKGWRKRCKYSLFYSYLYDQILPGGYNTILHLSLYLFTLTPHEFYKTYRQQVIGTRKI